MTRANRQRRRLARVLLALLFTHAFACSDRHDVAGVCAQIAETHCRRLFECFTDERVSGLGFPVPLEQCISVRVGECRGLTLDTACVDDGMYSREAAEICLKQTQELRCGFADANNTRRACDAICTGDPDADSAGDI